MKLSNKVYDYAKWVVMILLPALGTLYAVLATQWDLPRPEAVVATLSAVAAFLGSLIGISTVKYNKSEE